MIGEQDRPSDPDTPIDLKFETSQENYDKLYSAAALLGESRTQALNRAMIFYYLLNTIKRFQTVSWTDVEGWRHTVLKIR